MRMCGSCSVLLCSCNLFVIGCTKVGTGAKAYEEAKAALKRWAHFQLKWAKVSM